MADIKLNINVEELTAAAIATLEGGKAIQTMVNQAVRDSVKKKVAEVVANDKDLADRVRAAAHATLDKLFDKGTNLDALNESVATAIVNALNVDSYYR